MSNVQTTAQVLSIAPDATNGIVESALALHRLGYSPIWVQGKQPTELNWNSLPNKTAEELQRSYKPGNNVGIRCGKWSTPKPGCGLVNVDVDVYDQKYAEAAYAKLCELTGGVLGHEVITGSGKGGRHYWYACPLDKLPQEGSKKVPAQSVETVTVTEGFVTKKKHAWKIEVFFGLHTVAPPSIHPVSGQPYQWGDGGMPSQGIPEIPAPLLDLLHDSGRPTRQPGQRQRTDKHPLDACLFIQHCRNEAATLSEPLPS